ncbi:hypothetical protein TI39_contig592g00007 [Zymoseptoria brevis]|uniref:Uncharacterized protein n=1 Tax=Zymoseptoria brevis TaxID=1047168 RepID=A0A0F4GLE9_9PEZI|nr:hypothetical protein TI39_contig592g00007 [Zymoseptoria brevis]
MSSSVDWDSSEKLLEPDFRAVARRFNDRFMHLSSPNSTLAKFSPAGPMTDGIVIAEGFACKDYIHDSAGPLSTCSKTCKICSSHFRPLQWQIDVPVLRYTYQYDDIEAAKVIQSTVDATSRDLSEARAAVSKYGDTLASRWHRRNFAKRNAIIIDALPTVLRKRYDQVLTESLAGKDLALFETSFSIPWLNAEAMADDPSNFLSLLHHRTESSNSDWNRFDSTFVEHGFTSGTLRAGYNPLCVVMEGSDSEIGKLVPWEKAAAHRSTIVGFPLAKATLDARALLAGFIISVVRALLGGKVEDGLEGSDKWKALASNGFKELQPVKLRSISRASGFGAPPMEVIPLLERAVQGFEERLKAAEMTCWTFHTDPLVVRQLMALSMEARVHKNIGEKFIRKDLLSLLFDACARPLQWRAVLQEAQKALKLCEENTTVASGMMPIDCAQTLHLVDSIVRRDFEREEEKMRVLTTILGTFDSHFTLDPITGAWTNSVQSDNDQLYSLLSRVGTHRRVDAPLPGRALHNVEHYIEQASGNDRDRLHELLLSCIRNMAVLDEATMGIRMLQSSAGSKEDSGPDLLSLKEASQRPSFEFVPYFSSYYKRGWEAAVDDLWPQLKPILSIPNKSTGKPNRKHLEAYDKRHAALDNFWNVEDSVRVRELTKFGPLPSEPCMTDRVRTAMGLTGYTEETARLRAELEAEVEKQEASKSRQSSTVAVLPTHPPRPISPPHSFFIPKTPSPKGPSPAKSKKKTRPKTPAVAAPTPAVPPPPPPAPPLPIFLNTASHALLTEIFLNSGKKTLSGTIRFPELVSALTDGGLQASQGTGGSAVVFHNMNPSGTRAGGRMTVHMPHPINVLNPIMAGDVAKKLRDRFGWSVERFMVRERGGGAGEALHGRGWVG